MLREPVPSEHPHVSLEEYPSPPVCAGDRFAHRHVRRPDIRVKLAGYSYFPHAISRTPGPLLLR
eukprot:6368356-Alexandrium_andersonii.AAC.1